MKDYTLRITQKRNNHDAIIQHRRLTTIFEGGIKDIEGGISGIKEIETQTIHCAIGKTTYKAIERKVH